jgi:fucose permease
MSIYALTFFGLMPIGALVMGLMAEHLGQPAAIFIGTGIMFLAAVANAVFVPRLRRQE